MKPWPEEIIRARTYKKMHRNSSHATETFSSKQIRNDNIVAFSDWTAYPRKKYKRAQ